MKAPKRAGSSSQVDSQYCRSSWRTVVEIDNYSKWSRQVLNRLQIYQAMNIRNAYDEVARPFSLLDRRGEVHYIANFG